MPGRTRTTRPRRRRAAKATHLLAEASHCARLVDEPARQGWAISGVITATAACGNHAAAMRISKSIVDITRRTRVLLSLGCVTEAAECARSIEQPSIRARLLALVGEPVNDELPDNLSEQGRTLAGLAGSALAAGDIDHAITLARRHVGSMVLADVIRTALVDHDRIRAEDTARHIRDPFLRATVLLEIAAAAIRDGDQSAGRRLAEEIDTMARSIDNDWLSMLIADVPSTALRVSAKIPLEQGNTEVGFVLATLPGTTRQRLSFVAANPTARRRGVLCRWQIISVTDASAGDHLREGVP